MSLFNNLPPTKLPTNKLSISSHLLAYPHPPVGYSLVDIISHKLLMSIFYIFFKIQFLSFLEKFKVFKS